MKNTHHYTQWALWAQSFLQAHSLLVCAGGSVNNVWMFFDPCLPWRARSIWIGLITETKCPRFTVTESLWRGSGLMRSKENTLPSEEQRLWCGQRRMNRKLLSLSNGYLIPHWAHIKHQNPYDYKPDVMILLSNMYVRHTQQGKDTTCKMSKHW